MILSGWNYGWYIIDKSKAKLIQVNNEWVDETIETVSVTLDWTVYNVNWWLYDTARSIGNDTAEFIGMKQ